MIQWIEQYLFFPNSFQRIVSILFFPLTILYCIVVAYKRIKATPYDFGIPIISIGNLIVGGSGKTPFTIALAKNQESACVILRGYGRTTKGLIVVSHSGAPLNLDVHSVGDEAIVLAQALPKCSVIVSEDRIAGVIKAKEMGAKIIYLDDGYAHHYIKKFDILIRPKIEPTNLFCLPSGGYRETKMMYAFVPIVVRDGIDFVRKVRFMQDDHELETLPSQCVIVTAISKPDRLLEFFPDKTPIVSFMDHHIFTQDEIDSILLRYHGYTLCVTKKDLVKLQDFNLPKLILIDLEIEIDQKVLSTIEEKSTRFFQSK